LKIKKVAYIGEIEHPDEVGFMQKRNVYICDVDNTTTATLVLFDEQVYMADLFKNVSTLLHRYYFCGCIYKISYSYLFTG
jgi:hypothetical protein